MEEKRKDRFISHAGEVEAIMPNCKNCGRCLIEDGLTCTLKGDIPLDIRLNKTKCEDYIEKE